MSTARSKALFRRARRVLVGGVNSPVRAFKSVGGTPLFIASGAGARIQDVDGNSYDDYCLSWGPLILGHARREVAAAAAAALRRGSTFGAATEAEIALAERLRAALPSLELLRLTSSGTEAAMSAARAARAFTKRELIVKFSGGYHGHADGFLVAAGSGARTLGVPDSAGVPAAFASATLVVPFNDAPALEAAFRAHQGRIAAVFIEPVPANIGVAPLAPGFLEKLRGLTAREGALLVFDEVITGFRVAYGGAQTVFKIKPDLTILGKIIGGGFPLAAYGGRRDVLSLVAPEGPVYQAGTLSGNPVAVAAGIATLDLLKKEKPYARLERLTRQLRGGLQDAALSAGVSLRVESFASMFTSFFADKKNYAKFFHGMLSRGIYLPPSQYEAAFLSAAHGEREIERFIAASRRVLTSRSTAS